MPKPSKLSTSYIFASIFVINCSSFFLLIPNFQSCSRLVLRIAVDDSTSFLKLSLKFGARLESAGKLLEHAAELGLEVIGVSFHVGSGCTQSLVFKQAIADARLVFDTAVGVMTFQYSTFYYATTYCK